jgi:hypothetical protein
MPAKLSTTIGSISSIPNPVNSTLVHDFYQYMKSIGTSDEDVVECQSKDNDLFLVGS